MKRLNKQNLFIEKLFLYLNYNKSYLNLKHFFGGSEFWCSSDMFRSVIFAWNPLPLVSDTELTVLVHVWAPRPDASWCYLFHQPMDQMRSDIFLFHQPEVLMLSDVLCPYTSSQARQEVVHQVDIVFLYLIFIESYWQSTLKRVTGGQDWHPHLNVLLEVRNFTLTLTCYWTQAGILNLIISPLKSY